MNVGLIGCGRIANGHMRVYRSMKNVKVVAVSDVDLGKARIFAENYGVSSFFSNYADLLETKDLDLVDVCTPPSTHALITCDAAKFGHNVLVEKPMARSTAECDKMLRQSKKHGVKLCVCHNQIFFPCIKQAKSFIESGYYDLVSFRTSIKEIPEQSSPRWVLTPKEKGILWEAGCHPAYLQLHFLKNITEVYAFGSKIRYPVYDSFAVLLRTPDQPYGIIELSWLAKEHEAVYEIDSSSGRRVQIDRTKRTLVEKSGSSNGVYSDIKKVLRHFVPSRKTLKTKFGYFIGHYHLIGEYMKSLENDTSPPVPPEEGKRTIKLLECIEESLNKHQVVQMK